MSPSVLSVLQVVLGPYGTPVKSINSRGHDPADLALLYERLGVVAVGEDGGADERREHHILAEEHVARARGQLHHVHQLRHHVDAVCGRNLNFMSSNSHHSETCVDQRASETKERGKTCLSWPEEF